MIDLSIAGSRLLRGRFAESMSRGVDYRYAGIEFTPKQASVALSDAVFVISGALGCLCGAYSTTPVEARLMDDVDVARLKVFPLQASIQQAESAERFLPLVDVVFESVVEPNAHDLGVVFELAAKTIDPNFSLDVPRTGAAVASNLSLEV